MTGGESGFWGRRRWRAEGLHDPRISLGPLSTCPPCKPGGAKGRERGGPPTTHLLSSSILRNGAFSLATGKETHTHEPSVGSDAGPGPHERETLRELRLCQGPGVCRTGAHATPPSAFPFG